MRERVCFSIGIAARTETKPKPEQYAALCKSTAWHGVLDQLQAAVPDDCTSKRGKFIKSLTQTANSTCSGISASVAGISQLTGCDFYKLTTIANSQEASQCTKDSTLKETSPTPEQYLAVCRSAACRGMLEKVSAAAPTDYAFKSGKSLNSLAMPVTSFCGVVPGMPPSGAGVTPSAPLPANNTVS